MKPTILILLFMISCKELMAQSKHPSLRLTDINGGRFQLSDYKGNVVLLNFWATWCPPCRTEIPELIKLQRLYRSQGLRIIGITYPPEKLSELRSFARRIRMNYRIVIGTKESRAKFTNAEVLPVTVVLDRDRVVREVIEGVMYQDEFDQKVKPLLQSPKTVPESPGRASPTAVKPQKHQAERYSQKVQNELCPLDKATQRTSSEFHLPNPTR
jgi:thiol-disulfide isomerase/thioredoxin